MHNNTICMENKISETYGREKFINCIVMLWLYWIHHIGKATLPPISSPENKRLHVTEMKEMARNIIRYQSKPYTQNVKEST